jgi:predicted RNase H-like HicB family nuclease
VQYGNLAFTAVFLKAKHGYVGFIEELPHVTAQAATIDEARKALHELTAVVFDAERQSMRELLAGKEVVRETFAIPLPRRAPAERSTDQRRLTVGAP